MNRLYMEHNRLTRLEAFTFAGMPNIRFISLQYNQISSVDKDAFQRTQQRPLDKLNTLKLSFNRIRELDEEIFKNLPSLSHLLLQYNQILQLHPQLFQPVPTLETLYLHNNPLRTLDPAQFANLAYLKILNLKRTGLSSLDDQLFSDLVRLEKLYLLRNRLQTLSPAHVANIPMPFELDIEGNPMRCCPDLQWLKDAETADAIKNRAEPTCQAPEDWNNLSCSLANLRGELFQEISL